ncbi:MAG TPA: universal stress protein [Gaiellaceae bacterium]|nr:universal stress protein [Gaiellaceae bacterium]
MSVFSRILVGVDGTDWGFEALRQALVLAEEDAVVRAVTAVDTAPAIHAGFQAARFADLLGLEAAEARNAAESILAGRPRSEARVVRGKPVDVLRRERDELDATAVALGGRRSSRFLGIVLGDTGTELVHDAACSVLLAYPSDDGEWRPQRIVVGLDSSGYARDALATADEIAAKSGGTVEVVSATAGGAVDRDAEWAARVQSWDSADPVHALVARSKTADLIVVGSRGARGLRALGSVSERVAHEAHCTALIVHDGR